MTQTQNIDQRQSNSSFFYLLFSLALGCHVSSTPDVVFNKSSRKIKLEYYFLHKDSCKTLGSSFLLQKLFLCWSNFFDPDKEIWLENDASDFICLVHIISARRDWSYPSQRGSYPRRFRPVDYLSISRRNACFWRKKNLFFCLTYI